MLLYPLAPAMLIVLPLTISLCFMFAYLIHEVRQMGIRGLGLRCVWRYAFRGFIYELPLLHMYFSAAWCAAWIIYPLLKHDLSLFTWYFRVDNVISGLALGYLMLCCLMEPILRTTMESERVMRWANKY